MAFLIFPAATNSFNVDSFRAQAIVKQLRETCNDIQNDMGTRLFEVCLRGRIPTGNDVIHQVSFEVCKNRPANNRERKKNFQLPYHVIKFTLSVCFLQEDIVRLKRCIYAAQRNNLPPICTHNIVQDNIDLVLCNLRRCKLFNNRYDRVKVSYTC